MTDAHKAVAGAFDHLREVAGAEWWALKEGGKPYVMVGTATCGRAAGACMYLWVRLCEHTHVCVTTVCRN